MWTLLRLTLLLFNLAFFHAPALGDGPTCSQMGAGPDDMIMESPSGLVSMNPKYMWDKRGGVVRVPIVLDHAYSHRERGIIFGGLQEIAAKTCVKFAVHKEPHFLRGHDYVHIQKTKSKGCWSYVGRVGNGKQDLSLPVGCINHRTVVHEMMHALGFSHEHVRHDRDNYVEILWGNIQRGRERNFEKKHGRADPFGPYDMSSIMHYERNAFSNNGQDTIRPLRGGFTIGRGRHMSHWDVVKINRMYKCGKPGYGGGGGGSYSNPFFGFGGPSGGPEGNEVDDEISFDDNGSVGGVDDSENDVFNEPEFQGFRPSRGPRGPPPRGIFHRPPGPPGSGPGGLPPPGPRGAPPLLSGPSPDYDDAPKGRGAPGPGISHGPSIAHASFPDNPFATIPQNPFSPRLGLPATNGVDENPTGPGATGAEYYDTTLNLNQQDVNKDFYNY